ncbi:hypothetical protein IAU60_001445 [Kwoniella sp. DSM 27419]
MDPTTFAHSDPFAAKQAPHLADSLGADMTSKPPQVQHISGLDASIVPSTGSSGLNTGFDSAPRHTSGSSSAFDSAGQSTTGASVGGAAAQPAGVQSHTVPIAGMGAGESPYANSGAGFNASAHADATSGATGTSQLNHGRSGSISNDVSPSHAAANARETASNATANAKESASNAANNASKTASNVANNAGNAVNNAAANASQTAQKAANSASNAANQAATGLRQRVSKLGDELNHASDHPAVKNAKGAANSQLAQLRQQLGRSQTVLDLEKRTGVDRVVLVFGGIAAYMILIPFNLLRLALPITTLLTILPASYLAAETLDNSNTKPSDNRVKSLLAYFVTLGFIQTIESLMAGFLERRIPQYYTVKLLFLAYLLHPRTQGALKVHDSVFRPVLARAQQQGQTSSSTYGVKSGSSSARSTGSTTATTPPTSKASLSSASSPSQATFGNVGSNAGGSAEYAHGAGTTNLAQPEKGYVIPVVAEIPVVAQVQPPRTGHL